MQARQLAAALLGIMGLWLLASAAIDSIFIFGSMPQATDKFGATLQDYARTRLLASVCLRVGIGLALLIARARLAAWLTLAREANDEPGSPDNWQPAAFAVLGCYFVVEGGSELVSLADTLNQLGSSFAGHAFQLAMGLLLFFGARTLHGFWQAARRAGHPK